MGLVSFAVLAASVTIFILHQWMRMVKSLRYVISINDEAAHTMTSIRRMEEVALGQAAWVEEKRAYLYELLNDHKQAAEAHDKNMSNLVNAAIARLGGVQSSPDFNELGAAYVNGQRHRKEQLAYA